VIRINGIPPIERIPEVIGLLLLWFTVAYLGMKATMIHKEGRPI
jgi:hypothetical protein